MCDADLAAPDDGPDIGEDPGGPVQLGLFSPDRSEVEAGFAALGRLELDRAESLLRHVLDRDPDDRDGLEGLAAVGHWRRALAEMEAIHGVERPLVLWRAVNACPAPWLPRALRRRLLEETLELLEMHAVPMPAPELCAGDVLLALGREHTARSWLEWAVRRAPDVARLHLLAGDAYWLTGSPVPARAAYSRGLLLDPTIARWPEVRWPELQRRIRAVGGPLATLEAWAEGLLPLPPLGTSGTPHPTVSEVWEALAAASDAMARRRHDDVVAHRMRLRDLAPDIFARYMARLEG